MNVEIDRQEPLYERGVPVLIKRDDREDESRMLMARVLRGMQKPANQQLLRMEFTDENDPFFLFYLEVCEEAYHELKKEQNLSINFATFPSKYIELLNFCLQARLDDSIKFRAELRISRSGNVFEILEANGFKYLNHLSLRFQTANDDDLKIYLSACVKKLKQKNMQLATDLSDREQQLETMSNECRTHKETLQDITRRRKLEQQTQLSAHAAEKNKLKEQTLERTQQMQQQHNEAFAKYKTESKLEYEKLSSLYEEAQAKAQSAEKRVFELQIKTEQLGIKVQTAHADLVAARKETATLRDSNQTLVATQHDTDKQYNKAKSSVIALEQQVKSKDEFITQLNVHISELKSDQLEKAESVKTLKLDNVRLQQNFDASVAEIVKGNKFIKRIQNKRKAQDVQIRTKNYVINEQEKRIQSLETCKTGSQRKEQTLNAKIESHVADLELLNNKLNDTKAKLTESIKANVESQTNIQYLNRQLNELKTSGALRNPLTRRQPFAPVNPAGAHFGFRPRTMPQV